MAVSAFRSKSKRSTSVAPPNHVSSLRNRPADDAEKKIPARRSRSVSAVSRYAGAAAEPAEVEFMNKRDNPLFSCSGSSPLSPSSESDVHCEVLEGGRSDFDSKRGRSVSRSSGFGKESSSNRSLSSVSTGGRRRSVSRGHYGNSERKEGRILKDGGVLDDTRNLHTWTSRHPPPDPWETSSSCGRARNWEDGISTSSHSETEDTLHRKGFLSDHSSKLVGDGGIYKTIRSEVRRAVYEVRDDLQNAIRQKNSAIINENVADCASEFVDHSMTELVSDFRREYATKLEQSQVRVRRLQKDLAIEEQHGQQLSEILKKILPDTKSSQSGKSRPRRKASIDRLKMSRRLTEEALNYFDECVSISTFDSSDFSSMEEPPPISTVSATPIDNGRCSSSENLSSSTPKFSNDHLDHHEESDDQTQCSLSFAESDCALSSICSGRKFSDPTLSNDNQVGQIDSDTPRSETYQFSFRHKQNETRRVHDIRHYLKNFEKDPRTEIARGTKTRLSYNADVYDLNTSAERLLSEKVIFRNRIDTGGLLICDIRIF
ncbi:uncharacterized protein LOC120269123 isoform X2 [Dioscorea cayenensis subsp. rotundata]|uniref:Uncharacterized protein LOC120269123 isoform X2 n=1 Tax=Dioscorea cayennensis subsp. rotundata TaxID=55577 RepID=A0AB40C0C3_DIOCR|nr:uncharacterized protein LOC120269123 isoform X2 [Dioscorea cayenensis subsp. rotundata]